VLAIADEVITTTSKLGFAFRWTTLSKRRLQSWIDPFDNIGGGTANEGPSLGYDLGVEGARTMMLVYNLPATDAIYQRFAGIGGSAYFVGGLGMTALTMNDIVVVPIRTGVGIRLGANVGYLKFTPTATWNPF
jgi:hypothetical protein